MTGMNSGVSQVQSRVRPGRLRLHVQPLWALLGVVLVLVSWTVASLQAPHPNPLKPLSDRNLVELLRFPIEVNAARRLPVAPNPIYGFALSADGQRGWAVGAGGTILAMGDGGREWGAQPSGVQVALWSVHFHADGQRGWAVGDSGTILSTNDGGRQWVRQTSGVQAALLSVQFSADGERGWAAGSDGTILSTIDGGRQWTPQTSGVPVPLSSVQFDADGQRGWVVGGGGTILATIDGGGRWAEQSSGVEAGLLSVQFSAGGQHGWAVGGRGTILATSDAGRHWTAQDSGTHVDLFSVHFNPDGQRGWAVGAGGTILATNDGGRHWGEQTSGVRSLLSLVRFHPDGQLGWAVGIGGTLLTTNDGGRTWAAHASGVQAALASVQFSTNGQRGWAVGSGGTILTTSDGGRHWAPQTSGVRTALFSVQFNGDGQRGWVVGAGGKILATNDGGHHWTAQTTGSEVDLSSVHFNADGQRGWAVGARGMILATSDGGRHWTLLSSGTQAALNSVHFSADGQRGWVVGVGGTILATTDGGLTWAMQTSPVQATLFSVHFSADGQRGWSVGMDGTIVATRDGGSQWVSQASGVQALLRSTQFAADGERGWAGGDGGAMLMTEDGGAHWTPVTGAKVGSVRTAVWITDASARQVWAVGYPPSLLHTADGGQSWAVEPWPVRYARWPAPWFWLSLVAAAWCWRQALRSATHVVAQGAEAMAATDAPAKDFTEDRLRFGPLAKGISRFLRNASTEPPLTMAVSGDWGSGKSSLMGLVCCDLRRHGSRPVWFNAWHHQKDEQLLAALLQAVRDQGLPPSWTPAGWLFRLRLLWVRSRKHFLLAFITMVAVTTVLAFLMTHDMDAWNKLWANVTEQLSWLDAAATGKAVRLSTTDLGKLSAQSLGGITALVALRKALTAFGADPAVLLSATAEQFRLKDASALTHFRARFAAQFSEVTRSLPYRMVIVIDDLDRCRPEAVLEVMEAVNFLVSSGSCFVIFGMATSRVQAALAWSFDKIASEMVELAASPGEITVGEKERLERERRRTYARDYMEKLVNLEIAVPACDDVEPHLLLQAPADGAGPRHRSLRALVSLWPLALCASAIALGWHLGVRWKVVDPPQEALSQAGVYASATAILAPAASAVASRAAAPAASTVAPTYGVPTVHPGDDQSIRGYAFALPIALLAGWAVVFAWVRLRSHVHQVKDSQAFRQALRTWMPLVQQHRKTPRALKRFGNRIRYLAMLQQAENLDESQLDALSAMMAGWWRGWPRSVRALADPPKAASPAYGVSSIDEEVLVALAALNEVCGPQWRRCVEGHIPEGAEQSVRQAILRHRGLYGASPWPPAAEAMDAFERSLQGVRIPA